MMEWNDKFTQRLRNCFNFKGCNLSHIQKEKGYIHFFPGPPWDVIKGKITGNSTYNVTLTMRGNEEIKFNDLKIADVIKVVKLYRG